MSSTSIGTRIGTTNCQSKQRVGKLAWDELDRRGEQLMRRAAKEGRGDVKAKNKVGVAATHACVIDGSTYTSKKRAGDLKKHEALIHGVDVVYYPCNQEGCEYKSRQGAHLVTHLAFIHDIGVKWHECDQKGCSYKAKQASNLRTHQAGIHGVDVVFYPCSQEGCDYKPKRVCSLKQHLAAIHDIGVKWHECDQKGCSYKAKQASNLRTHQARKIHGFVKAR